MIEGRGERESITAENRGLSAKRILFQFQETGFYFIIMGPESQGKPHEWNTLFLFGNHSGGTETALFIIDNDHAIGPYPAR